MSKIKYKDVELNILKDIPIETDYMIADLFQNSKDTDVYILNTVIEESQHYNIDTLDYGEIADYLNNINDDIREYYNYIINYPLDKFGKGYLSVAYKYCKEHKTCKDKYIGKLLDIVYKYIEYGEFNYISENDINKLHRWLDKLMDNDKDYAVYYRKHEI